MGRVLGRQAQAQAAVAGVEAAIRDIRAAHPEFAGETYSSSFLYQADAITTINSTEDYAVQLLAELGLPTGPVNAVLAHPRHQPAQPFWCFQGFCPGSLSGMPAGSPYLGARG